MSIRMRYPCPTCGWKNTRPSFRRGLGDAFLTACLLKPYRCKSCNARFFRFKYPWARLAVPVVMVLLLAGLVTGIEKLL